MSTQNAPRKGEFYILRSDMGGGGRGPGLKLDNPDAVPFSIADSMPGEDGGLAALKETPRLRYDSRIGDMPDDLESGLTDYWLVSEPLKLILEAADPEGFAFALCDFRLEDGTPGAPHYLCEVVRIIDAIDEEASTVKVLAGYPNGKYYSLVGGAELAFRKDVVGAAHVFRTPHTADAFCDRFLRDTLISQGFGKPSKRRGVRLIDAANYG
ncbi:imm11 family protein [Xanthomonas dyei]|uniref:imm11 family protein n=1 Tax=Xanthomonas dyei TaxID=743699 RepID=UPI0032E912C7